MSPPVSVIVSTRNRAARVTSCVSSILANSGDFELLVVDQSDHETPHAEVGDRRVRWIATGTRGLSVSRNIGVAEAQGPLLAFTDDDCRVPTDWVASVLAAFESDPATGLLFGAVLLRPEDRAIGYAAEFEPHQQRNFQHCLPDIRMPWGVGANMAIRRTVFDRVGMFDPSLGAGTPFFAGEDIDLTIRALNAGLKVVFTPKTSVTHLGIREGADAARLLRGYGIGLGATLTKHMRLGTEGATRMLAQFVAHHGKRSLGNVMRGSRHPGFGLVASVLWGGVRSYEKRIDSVRGVYVA